MLWIYRWCLGTVQLVITGDVAEVMLNLCSRNGLTLWDVKREKSRIKCRMTVRDFKQLRRIIRRGGVRVHITEKHGLPFFTSHYRKRWGIPAGAALFFASLKLLSCFIWSVEVTGNREVAAEDILAACQTIGIDEGVYAKGVDYKTTGQKLLLAMPELAWASLNLEGCRVTVNVSEAEKNDREENRPCNLKARADGIVTRIDVKTGDCVVKVGDTVRAGDLLVSGVAEKAGTTRWVHAAGSITAQTTREVTASASFRQTVTGKTATRRVLEIFGVAVPLYLGKLPAPYESQNDVSAWRLLGETLPVRMHRKTFWFTEEQERLFSREELEEQLTRQINEQLAVENIAQFEVKNREFDETNDGLTLKMLILSEEDIAWEEILLFSTGNQ